VASGAIPLLIGDPYGTIHHPVCIEAEEGLSPPGMDSGLKEGEQGFSRPSTPRAIIALVCARLRSRRQHAG